MAGVRKPLDSTSQCFGGKFTFMVSGAVPQRTNRKGTASPVESHEPKEENSFGR